MPRHDDPLRRAALRAALAVSTLTVGALPVGCTTEAPPDELLIAVDASADTASDAPGDTADTDQVAECGVHDGICPVECYVCGDPDCCMESGGDWTPYELEYCDAGGCPTPSCCDSVNGKWIIETEYICEGGACGIPGPFRPPAVRV